MFHFQCKLCVYMHIHICIFCHVTNFPWECSISRKWWSALFCNTSVPNRCNPECAGSILSWALSLKTLLWLEIIMKLYKSFLHSSKTVYIPLLRFVSAKLSNRRFQWPWGLRRGSAVAYLIGLRFRIPPGACMPVTCECCFLLSRGLCNGSVTRPDKSYRVWCVWVWSRNLNDEKAGLGLHCLGLSSHEKINYPTKEREFSNINQE